MFNMLAMVPVFISGLVLVGVIILFLLIFPMLKKSKKVDNLTDGLFNEHVSNTVDDCIDKIQNGKDGLVQKGKEVAQEIKDKIEEQTKIDKNL